MHLIQRLLQQQCRCSTFCSAHRYAYRASISRTWRRSYHAAILGTSRTWHPGRYWKHSFLITWETFWSYQGLVTLHDRRIRRSQRTIGSLPLWWWHVCVQWYHIYAQTCNRKSTALLELSSEQYRWDESLAVVQDNYRSLTRCTARSYRHRDGWYVWYLWSRTKNYPYDTNISWTTRRILERSTYTSQSNDCAK